MDVRRYHWKPRYLWDRTALTSHHGAPGHYCASGTFLNKHGRAGDGPV
jgi:hypothetical protein